MVEAWGEGRVGGGGGCGRVVTLCGNTKSGS